MESIGRSKEERDRRGRGVMLGQQFRTAEAQSGKGTGFTQAELAKLQARLAPLAQT